MDFSSFLRRTGANLRKARWLAGMTQEEVAARGGITYRHYQELEGGRVNPTLKTLRSLAVLLGRTVAELVDVDPLGRARRPSLADAVAEPPRRGRRPRAHGQVPSGKRRST